MSATFRRAGIGLLLPPSINKIADFADSGCIPAIRSLFPA